MQIASTRPARAAPHPARAAGWRTPPGLVLAVIAAGVAAVIALWWRDTPAVTGLGDTLTGAGRILGLLAGYDVVVLAAERAGQGPRLTAVTGPGR